MATKALNFKMDEAVIAEMKDVASVYHMTVTDIIKEAVSEYIDRLKSNPFYRLTANVREADAEESAEILDAIDGMSDDDLTIASVEHLTL